MDVFDRDRPGGLTDRYVAFTPSSTTDRVAVSIRNMARNARGIGMVENVQVRSYKRFSPIARFQHLIASFFN